MEFFFEDNLRLDWGLGNPNKTAALIACLLVVVHLFRLLPSRRWGRVLFVISFLSLGICLIHTYSRGGLVAALGGQILYGVYLTRGRFSIPGRKVVLTAAGLFLFLAGYASLPQVNASSRYALGVVPGGEEDLSISNRIRIWKDAPRMMVDAPGGWGSGRAGEGWMQWYQPLETRYRYRTLVNSHLTWLVETGWPGRLLYCFAWLFLFLALFPGKADTSNCVHVFAVAAGVWFSFAIAAFFSSVAESPALWAVPLAVLVPVCSARWIPGLGKSRIVRPGTAIVAVITASLLCFLFFAIGKITGKDADSKIRVRDGVVHYGNSSARFFLVNPDVEIVGRHYGHTIREQPGFSIYVLPGGDTKELPAGDPVIVVSGKIETKWLEKRPVVILNPENLYENWDRHDPEIHVFLGATRRDPVARALRLRPSKDKIFAQNLTSVPGKQIFLGNWVSLLKQHSTIHHP